MNRAMRVAWPALSTLVALGALIAALVIGGGAAAVAGDDDGAVLRFGLPVAQLLMNLAASGTVGALVLAAFALSPAHPAWDRLLDAAAAIAGVWTVAAATITVLVGVGFTGPPTTAQFGPRFLQYLSTTDAGQSWLASTVAAALVTVLAIAARSMTGVALVAAGSIAALVPMALQGHAATAPGDHGAAIVAFGLHIVGAAVWLGGLGVLLVLGLGLTGRPLADLAARYSGIALVAFIVVGFSGVVSAWIRLGGIGGLFTAYGALVIVKSTALVIAGLLGAAHRTVTIPRLVGASGRRPFLRLVAVELLVLGVASGFAAGLAFSAPPEGEFTTPTTPAEILTGLPLPPPFGVLTMLSQWRIDPLWSLICGFLAVFYVLGVRRLRRRGDSWPLGRTICWLAGLALLWWLTSGGLAVYQDVLFSAHMLEHMALTLMVPLLLVPAAPVTLAMRAVQKRQDGSRGAREWILWAVHSRVATVLANPLVAAVLFAGSLVVFYYSPVFRWAVTDHIGHEWMTTHFLITGYLFVQSLIGVDPVPFRFPYPIRLLVLLATMAFHAFFGLALILGSGLLLSDWYGAMGWGTSAIADQQAGGGIMWSVGEIPTLVLAVVVAISWSKSDAKEAKRTDRSEDRTDDSQLRAYNDMLTRLERGRA